MPRVAIPTNRGQYTNTDEFASGQPGQIVNLLVDEHGTLTSRPGLLSWSVPVDAGAGLADSPGQRIIGLAAYLDRIIAVRQNRRVFSVDSTGAASDITDAYLTGSELPKFLIDDDGTLLIFGGGAPLRVGPDLRANTFATNLGGSPTHGGIVDRVLLVNDHGSDTVYFSDAGNHSRFGFFPPEMTPGFFTAGTRSDAVTALKALQNRAYLFGRESVEVFYGTGGVLIDGIPVVFRIEDEPLQSELGASGSVIEVDGTLWWVDGDRRAVRMEGRTTRPVSLPVEAQIQALSDWTDCVTHLFEYQGHQLILFHFDTVGLTLAYDYVRNLWTEWRKWSTSASDWTSMPLTAYAFQPRWNRHFCAGDLSGAIFELSPTTYEDNSGPLVRLWRGPYFDADSLQLKFAKRMQFLVDGGVATSHTSTAEAYNPTIEVRWRNEDRQWQDWQPMQTGRIGYADTVRDVWCRTNFRRQQIEWRYSGATPLRVNRIEYELTERTR